MSAAIEIVDYDPRWPLLFEQERTRLLATLGQAVTAVEHVGSTAVPGLGAKPIVDLLVGVHTLDLGRSCVQPLAGLGYRYVPEFEAVMPYRLYFWKGTPDQHEYHVHMVVPAGEFWVRLLLFRDYLRTHPETARQYEQLKRALAPRFGADREGYANAKTEFVRSIEAKARDECE